MTGLARPADGRETQPFGTKQLQDGEPHAGTDFGWTDAAGNVRKSVYAAEAGEVLYAGDSRALGWPNPWHLNPDFNRADGVDSSAGNVLVIGHRDGVTTYCHLAAWTVAKGQQVTRRQRIATMGDSGNTNGIHLHFEWIPYPFNFGTRTYGRARPTFSTTISPQGTTVKDPFSMYTDKERAEILAAARKVNRYLDAPIGALPGKIFRAIFKERFTRARVGGTTSLEDIVRYYDANREQDHQAAAEPQA